MKKLIALLLAMVMVLSLAACGGNTEAEAPAADAPAAEPVVVGEIGSPDAPVTVKVVCKDVFPDEEDVQKLCAAINEKMAAEGKYVDVQFVEPPASGYASAMPLAVMNGEVDADIIYFQGGDKPLADQGLLEDLTPYIAGSTHVKSLMDESNVAKMESYPYLLWLAPPRVSTPVVRTDWLEGVASYEPWSLIPLPTTTSLSSRN